MSSNIVQWIKLEDVEPGIRPFLTGELPVPEGRFVPVSVNPISDLRNWAAAVALVCAFAALLFIAIFPLTAGGDPDWGLGIGAALIAAIVWGLRKKLPSPQVPVGKGTYFLQNALVVFDGKSALIVPRHDITGMLTYRNSHWYILRGDLPKVGIESFYIWKYDYTGDALVLPFEDWRRTGEPLSAPRRSEK